MTTAQTRSPVVHDVELVALDDLAPHPRNYRSHPPEQLEHLSESLREHGIYRNVVVARDGTILAGHGVVEAARQAQLEQIAVVRLPIAPDDPRALKLLTADNELPRLAIDDDRALAQLLEQVRDEDVDGLRGTGWDDDALDELLARFDAADDLERDDDERRARYTFDVYDREQLLDAAIASYRERGFPYRNLPRHVCMYEINRLAATRVDSLMNTRLGYQVADTYHPQRFAARVGKTKTPLEVFADDRLLRVALELLMDYDLTWSESSVVATLGRTRGAQGVSNFRPGVTLSYLRRYAPDDAVVLDTSTGYGGRLVGFLASRCSRYVGIDPASDTHAGNQRLTAELCPASKYVELHQLPAEDVPHELLQGRCDVAITSPPYFSKEHYADEPTQSFKRYPQADDWRAGFLRPMLELQRAALKPDAISVLNIADVKIGSQVVPLVDWALHDARDVGFEIVALESMPLTHHVGAGEDKREQDGVVTEPLIVMRKTS